LLIDYGPFLKPPDIKKLQRGLYELRILGKSSIRVFYTIIRREYLLLHAFKKKSQKTPLKEMKIALDRAQELL
jgi:phage-related protein